MNFIRITEAAEKWGVNSRMVRYYCMNDRVPGAIVDGDGWLIRKDLLLVIFHDILMPVEGYSWIFYVPFNGKGYTLALHR